MSGNASASFSSTLSEGYHTLSNNVAQTWNEPEHYDLYVPAITWHARFAYDKEKTDKYNERPWGAGFGVSRWDEKGNWHGLYLMAFKDSFNKWDFGKKNSRESSAVQAKTDSGGIPKSVFCFIQDAFAQNPLEVQAFGRF